jgi:hypothetical protein
VPRKELENHAKECRYEQSRWIIEPLQQDTRTLRHELDKNYQTIIQLLTNLQVRQSCCLIEQQIHKEQVHKLEQEKLVLIQGHGQFVDICAKTIDRLEDNERRREEGRNIFSLLRGEMNYSGIGASVAEFKMQVRKEQEKQEEFGQKQKAPQQEEEKYNLEKSHVQLRERISNLTIQHNMPRTREEKYHEDRTHLSNSK